MSSQEKPQYYILSNELVHKIISFMDIDTRRSLGIYTKLKIPQTLKDKIKFKEIKKYDSESSHSIGYLHTTYNVKVNILTEITRTTRIVYNYYIYHNFYKEGVLYTIAKGFDHTLINEPDDVEEWIEAIKNQDLNTEKYREYKNSPTVFTSYGYKDGKCINYHQDTIKEVRDIIFRDQKPKTHLILGFLKYCRKLVPCRSDHSEAFFRQDRKFEKMIKITKN